MNILVTGGAGFIGSHVVDFLINQDHNVRIVDNLSGGSIENINQKATFIKGNLLSKKITDKVTKNIDIVYHLVADPSEGLSIFSPIFNVRNTYLTSLQLLVSCINNNVKTFVNVSSMAAYGIQKEIPMKEHHISNPVDPYGLHKLAFENILKLYSNLYNFNYVTIRPHNVYGERQRLDDPYRNVIGIFMNRILQNRPLFIYGNGEQKRSFTYIDDCAPYIAKAAFTKKAYGHVFNIGNEEPITLNKLTGLLLEITKSKVKIVYKDSRLNEVKEAYCSSEKAKKILGYKTNTDIKTGIQKMWDWAKNLKHTEFKYNKKFEINQKEFSVWKNQELNK